MAGAPNYDCCSPYYDATMPTNVTCSCTPSSIRINDTVYANSYYYSYKQTVKKVIKKTKERLMKERADKLHRKSFIMVQEMKPNIFKTIGFPFKDKPEVYHKNFGIRV